MYINGFVIPVPEEKKAEYQDIAEKFWEIAKDYGALSQVEAWEADVKDGTLTDFRRAVNVQPGEKVVFSWMTWKDRATADASHEKMMTDPRMKQFGETMPFDGKRMIFGGFEPLVIRQDRRLKPMISYLKFALLFGIPFGIFMGLTSPDSALFRGVFGGAFFGALMAAWLVWYLRRHRLRLEAKGIAAKDMRPRQLREVHLSVPPSIALDACAEAIRQIPKARLAPPGSSADTLVARVGLTMRSVGERISVTALPAGAGSIVRIQSAPLLPTTMFDFGKGLENVESVCLALKSFRVAA